MWFFKTTDELGKQVFYNKDKGLKFYRAKAVDTYYFYDESKRLMPPYAIPHMELYERLVVAVLGGGAYRNGVMTFTKWW